MIKELKKRKEIEGLGTSLGFGRIFPVNYLDVFFPTTTDAYIAETLKKLCEGGRCSEDYIEGLKEIKVSSDKGITVDIQTPHEMTFRFKGDHKCENGKERMMCKLGEPVEKPIDIRGEFVISFVTDNIALKNIPYRDSYFFETPLENWTNHWYMNNMVDTIHEINISPEKIKEVELNLRHPSLLGAKIKLKEKTRCVILADPKMIRERRKLYCP